MPEMPSPILIFGDKYLSKNNVIAAKKKYSTARWITKSATTDSLNSIRMEAGVASWDDEDKIILIEDIPDRKHVREFLLDLGSSCPSTTKLIIWDSNGRIKVNPKTQTFDKTWGDFVKSFKRIDGNKVINNGSELTEKDDDDSATFIQKCFEKHGRTIGKREIKLLIDIVGHNRGMLHSDIEKMCLTAPSQISTNFILENAFPSSREAIQYKLANVFDNGTYEESINMMERFIEAGTNPNVIAEICVRKARWQMIATYLWVQGLSWRDVVDKIMEMGKFPAIAWHNPSFSTSEKRAEAEQFQSPEQMVFYMTRKQGLLDRHFKSSKPTKSKKSSKPTISRKGAEVMPMPFMAQQVVDFIRNKIVSPNNVNTPETRTLLLNRAIRVYLFAQDKLAEVRYGSNPVQDLEELVRVLTNVNLKFFSNPKS
jgi:hypothetical protein